MFIIADQLICHAIGDYILQSHWMATEKTKRWLPCLVHVILYGIPFLFLRPSILAMVVIVGSHYAIDRYRLARFVVFAKNYLAPKKEWESWSFCCQTGYAQPVPGFLSIWLLIIADNILHVLINAASLKYL